MNKNTNLDSSVTYPHLRMQEKGGPIPDLL